LCCIFIFGKHGDKNCNSLIGVSLALGGASAESNWIFWEGSTPLICYSSSNRRQISVVSAISFLGSCSTAA
jgi:hypothetical protein